MSKFIILNNEIQKVKVIATDEYRAWIKYNSIEVVPHTTNFVPTTIYKTVFKTELFDSYEKAEFKFLKYRVDKLESPNDIQAQLGKLESRVDALEKKKSFWN